MVHTYPSPESESIPLLKLYQQLQKSSIGRFGKICSIEFWPSPLLRGAAIGTFPDRKRCWTMHRPCFDAWCVERDRCFHAWLLYNISTRNIIPLFYVGVQLPNANITYLFTASEIARRILEIVGLPGNATFESVQELEQNARIVCLCGKPDSGNRLRLASWYVDETLASVVSHWFICVSGWTRNGWKRLVWRHPEAFWKVGDCCCFLLHYDIQVRLLTEESWKFRLNNDHDIFQPSYLYSSSPYGQNYRKSSDVWSGDFEVWAPIGRKHLYRPVLSFTVVIALLVVLWFIKSWSGGIWIPSTWF